MTVPDATPSTSNADTQSARHERHFNQHLAPVNWVTEFQSVAIQTPNLPVHLFAIVDAALDDYLWRAISARSHSSQPLLQVAAQGQSASKTPHLVQFNTQKQPSTLDELNRLLPSPAVTLIASTFNSDELRTHFQFFLDIKLSGGLAIILAFWDPAILGTLVGQNDDITLHVPGPVLTAAQKQQFLRPISGWWYTDREAHWHSIDTSAYFQSDTASKDSPLQLTLTQAQEDLLIEASLPDLVLYHLELNQPLLFPARQPHYSKYRFVRIVLEAAKELGLTGVRDLVNFTALCLVYRERMQTDERILQLLDQVSQKQMTLDQVMTLMPE